MSGPTRTKRWFAMVGSALLCALSVITVQPATPVRADDPPQYYAMAIGLTDNVNGIYSLSDSGIAGARSLDAMMRVTAPTVEPLEADGFPFAINDSGTIVGYLEAPSSATAIRIDGSTVTPLSGLGRAYEIAYDINESGTIVGMSDSGSGFSQAWVDDGTTVTDLETLGGDYSIANKVNESGLIAGSARDADGDMHVVTWQDGVIQDLGSAPVAGGSANVTDLNDAGHILGSMSGFGFGDHAVVWDGTTLVDLGSLGGPTTYPGALNASGDVVVSTSNSSGKMRAAFWDGGALEDLGTLGGGQAWAGGINDEGLITGTSEFAAGSQTHGFLIDDGVMYDLNDLLPADSVEITDASWISDSGHIIAGSRSGAVLLVPGPRPPAAYDVIDLGASLGPSTDAFVQDINEDRQAAGSIDGRAFRFDGSTASWVFATNHESSANAINAAGHLVGYGTPGGNYLEAFLDDGTIHWLGTLGGPQSYGRDLNDAGDIIGDSQTSAGQNHAFLYRGGTMIDLHDLGGTASSATDLNEAGTVIGNYSPTNGVFRGFVSDGTTTTDLGTLGGNLTSPYAISDAGVIVGTTSTPTDPNHAFRYENGTMTSVAPPGSTMSDAVAINEAGVISGSYVNASGDRRGYVLEDGEFTLIPGLGGAFSSVSDINESGQVVGYATTATASRAFLFDDGVMTDLSTQIPLGYDAVPTYGRRILEDGTILVTGLTSDFRSRALLLVPTTPQEPPLLIDTSDPAPASVAKYGRFEKTFSLNRSYGTDVHDPDVIDVTATFTAPSGATYTTPAFWSATYEVRPGTGYPGAPNGSSEAYDETAPAAWHVRFSPDEVGTWTYRLQAQDKVPGHEATKVSGQLSFQVTASSATGQVERDADDRFLRYQDGTPYYPMGHNVAFQQGEPLGYDGQHYVEPLFASMEAAGQNWTRIWMSHYNGSAIEWTNGTGWYAGVGQYADQGAFRTELQLESADDHGLQVQVVFDNYREYRDFGDGPANGSEWPESPYNAANGGPVPSANPEEFFTNAEAKELYKQRLRYIVARYGAYRNVLAWELFNEFQFVGTPSATPFSDHIADDINDWHAEMSAYLRSIDPYDHLITTSSPISTRMADVWLDPNMDLVQVHDYEPGTTDRAERFHGYAVDLNATYNKPVIIGEFGINGEPEINFDPVDRAPLDANESHLNEATHLHNATWAAAMSGSGAMSWWWGAYIHSSPDEHRGAPNFPANERHNPPLRDFFAGEDLAALGLASADLVAPSSVVAMGLDNGVDGFYWVRDALNEYGTGSGPGQVGSTAVRTISGVTLTLLGFDDFTHRVEVHDPWGERPMDDSLLVGGSGGSLRIPLPDFTRDIALKVYPINDVSGSQPVLATVTSPNAGVIQITESPTTDPPPVGSGYTFLDTQLDITAPAATTADPLSIAFTVDTSLLASVDPDLTAATLTVFRNGTPVAECTPSGADDPATPDPCVSTRATLSDGDARITVLTSAASTWNFGVGAATAPGAPTGVTATKGDRQATVSWTAPSDGGSPITGYTVTSSPGNRTATVNGTTTTAIVTGLTNGTSYTFTVRATNATGTGPASAPSNAVTPAALLAQTISFPNPGAKTLLQSPVTVAPTASSGLPVTLTSTTQTVCTVTGLVISLHAVGSCSITATQPGNADYRAANPVTRSFNVTKAAQTITFANPGAKTLLQTPFTVAPTASSGLPVTLASTTLAVCTVDGFEVTLLVAGSCTLSASQPGDAVYNAAPTINRTFAVNQVAQTITFVRPANTNLLASPLTLAPTASSGLPVTLISGTTPVCTVDGFVVTLLTTGTCRLTASQSGDTVYRPANSITRSFTIAKAPQTITLPSPGPQSLAVGSVELSPSASSGLPVTLTSQTASVCTVGGTTVTLLRTGNCRVRATQPGDSVYAAAQAVTINFAVTQ